MLAQAHHEGVHYVLALSEVAPSARATRWATLRHYGKGGLAQRCTIIAAVTTVEHPWHALYR